MKRLAIILLLGCIVSSSYGQLYVQPSVGYSFSSHPITMESVFITDELKTVYTADMKFGQSLNAGLTLGYELWDHLFIELTARQAVYSRQTAYIEQPALETLDNFYISGFFGEMEYYSPVFQFAPQIGYKVKRNKFSAYFGIGPNFMKTEVNEIQRSVNYEFSNWSLVPVDVMMKREYRGPLHTGLQADMGLSYSVGPQWKIVLVFVTTYNNYEITEGVITDYEVEGTSRIGSLDNTDITIYPGDDRVNHSYYGITIGVRYVPGRKE